jgi:hypothetical protein
MNLYFSKIENEITVYTTIVLTLFQNFLFFYFFYNKKFIITLILIQRYRSYMAMGYLIGLFLPEVSTSTCLTAGSFYFIVGMSPIARVRQ